MNYIINSIINNRCSDIIIPLLSIPTIDLLLCIFFGTNARWFQLHSVINGIITYINNNKNNKKTYGYLNSIILGYFFKYKPI